MAANATMVPVGERCRHRGCVDLWHGNHCVRFEQLWNTVYSNRALDQLRAQSYSVLESDAGRLSAFIRDHIGIDGHYAFRVPDLGGAHRRLRDPDSSDDD